MTKNGPQVAPQNSWNLSRPTDYGILGDISGLEKKKIRARPTIQHRPGSFGVYGPVCRIAQKISKRKLQGFQQMSPIIARCPRFCGFLLHFTVFSLCKQQNTKQT